MKQLFHLLFALLITHISYSQVFWTEAFENSSTGGAPAAGSNTGNGPWTVTDASPATDLCGDPTSPNMWYVSCQENGNAAGICGSGCGTDESLHIGSTTLGDMGASYDAGGWCAAGLGGLGFFGTPTDARAESPTINCSAYSNITLSFNYIENGQGAIDDATLWWFNGTVWAQLSNMAKSTICAGQGLWTAYSIALPAGANANANVKIGFRWVNDDDGAGTDPSFAVDDITLSVVAGGNTITTGTITGSPFCACTNVNVPFTSTGTFTAGNIYTAQLSNAAGSFAAPVSIGTLNSVANSGTIACTIPCNTPTGAGYRIRVISSAPSTTGTDNGVNITINAAPAAPTASVSTQPTCATPTGTITVTVPAPGAGITYTLTGTAPVVAPVTNATGIFSGLAAGNYTVTTTVAGCTSTTTALTVNAAPAGPAAPTASVTTQPTCAVPVGTITVTLPAPGAGITYTLTGTAPVVAPVTNATGIFSGLAAGNYTVTTTVAGCTSTTTALTVNPAAGAPAAPTASITTQPTCVLATGTATVTAPAPAAGITYTIVGTAPVVAPVTNATGIFTGLTPGSYSVVVTIAGCNSGGTPLTVNAQPVAPAAPTATVSTQPTCAVSTGTITVTVPAPAAGTTYTLTGTAPVVAPQTNATGIFTGLASGDYTVTATVGGCTSPTTALTVNAAPATPAAPTASITTQPTCATPTGTATVTVPAPAAGTTYTITGTAPVVAPVTNTTGVFSGLTVGDYTITTTVGGCTSPTTALTVNAVIGAPVITVLTEIDVTCFGDTDGSASISAAGGTAPYTYAWSPTGGTGASATNLAAGNYTVTTTDFTGCATVQAITIGSPTQIVVGGVSVDVNCGTGALGQITTSATGGNGVYTYSWTLNGETTSSLTNLSTGNYSVTVTDGALCSATEAYTISTSGSIAITVTPPTATIVSGESVTLVATGGTTYSWTPTNGLSCTNCSSPIATPSATTTYIVTSTDASGCTGTDSTIITVNLLCGEVYVPTIFSPNESGASVNNTLCVFDAPGCIKDMTFAIYNLWGEKVFESIDQSICWDGMYKGKQQNSGVYVYKLLITFSDNTFTEKSGNITLVR